MAERVARLDRSMDFVLVFLSVISAAIFQYVTALPYDPTKQSEVETFVFFTHFSLKLLFLPILLIIPVWLAVHLTRNENWRMLLRAFIWNFASTTMALNIIVLLALSFPFNMNYLVGIVVAAIIVGIAFGLALILQFTIFRAYRRALMLDARAPARDFFFETRWKVANLIVAELLPFITWSGIILLSLQ